MALGAIIKECAEVTNCPRLADTYVGPHCTVRDSSITSSTALAHCEISSAHLLDAVMHQSCKVLTGAQLNGVLMFPHSSVTSQAKVSESVLGPDCAISIGECHHSLLGPHSGFHHQALLIAASWPMGRGNIAYGAMIGADTHCVYTDCISMILVLNCSPLLFSFLHCNAMQARTTPAAATTRSASPARAPSSGWAPR